MLCNASESEISANASFIVAERVSGSRLQVNVGSKEGLVNVGNKEGLVTVGSKEGLRDEEKEGSPDKEGENVGLVVVGAGVGGLVGVFVGERVGGVVVGLVVVGTGVGGLFGVFVGGRVVGVVGVELGKVEGNSLDEVVGENVGNVVVGLVGG